MADDHGGHGKEKKSFGQILVTIALALLFFMIFLFVANAFLGMIFPSITESIRIVGQGLQGSGTELVRANVSLGIFMNGVFGILIRLLIVLLGFAITAKLAMAIAEWVRPKTPAPAGAHP